mmetsp:Transcript_21975/g.32572  ORF Transcript_21975/g.32572 Transcript_21975/m.32572 type:complete len:350 (+) Transcript_21975:154-1203(+)
MKYSKILSIALYSAISIFTADAFLVKQSTVPMHSIRHRQNAPLNNRNVNLGIPRGGKTMLAPNTKLALTFDNAPFTESLSIYAAVNALGFAISILTGSHIHLDLLGTGAFALASLPTLFSSTCLRVTLSSAAVFTWGTKLAGFLFFRALKVKTDGRLDGTLNTTSGAFGFWLLSFVWGIISSLPHTLGTTSTNPGSPITLVIGGTVYLLGLATESLADYQKWCFKNSNPGRFCNEGLWSISQHPNFFGNLLLWSGVFIMNSDSLIESGGDGGILSIVWGARRLMLALATPLFLWTLFSGQANGTITNAVEMANDKYGKIPGFQDYVKNVPKIIPNIISWMKQLLFMRNN